MAYGFYFKLAYPKVYFNNTKHNQICVQSVEKTQIHIQLL